MAKKNSGKKRDKQQQKTAELAGAKDGAEAGGDGGVQAALDEALQRIEQLEQELAGAKDRHLRAVAELDNFKRRTCKEKIELSGYVRAEVFGDIIGLVDSFERFFKHVDGGGGGETLDESFLQGVELIHKSLQKVLKKYGVEPINETGVPVDYNLHQGLMTQPVDDEQQDQSVVEILEVGYKIGDKLIRPAKVKVGEFGG